jgi:hypothetical protein
MIHLTSIFESNDRFCRLIFSFKKTGERLLPVWCHCVTPNFYRISPLRYTSLFIIPSLQQQTILNKYNMSDLRWRQIDKNSKKTGWKLFICNRETLRATTYLVHPEVVIEGPRSSDYLATIFKAKQCPADLTIVEVKNEFATAVPWLLNFMYYGSGLKEHDVEWKVLYELAVEWNVISLQTDIAKGLTRKLRSHNAIRILTYASRFRSGNPLMEAVIQWCAYHLTEFQPVQAREIEPKQFLKILRCNMTLGYGIRMEEFQRSDLVAHCIHANNDPQLTSPKVLFALTNEDILPFVSAQFEAPEFLIAVSRICKTPEDQELLSDLEDRCIQSMTTYWKDCVDGFRSRDSLKKFFSKLPIRVLLALLQRTKVKTASKWQQLKRKVSQETMSKIEPKFLAKRLMEVVDKVLETNESSTDEESVSSNDQDDDLSVTDPLEHECVDDYIQHLGLPELLEDNVY